MPCINVPFRCCYFTERPNQNRNVRNFIKADHQNADDDLFTLFITIQISRSQTNFKNVSISFSTSIQMKRQENMHNENKHLQCVNNICKSSHLYFFFQCNSMAYHIVHTQQILLHHHNVPFLFVYQLIIKKLGS